MHQLNFKKRKIHECPKNEFGSKIHDNESLNFKKRPRMSVANFFLVTIVNCQIILITFHLGIFGKGAIFNITYSL